MPPKVISGISSCFQLLFQCQGQVAHVLLTRSPLVYPRRGLTVRLACVKHAASVRPEPGSNSPLKSIQIRRTQGAGFVVSTRSIADKKTQAGSSSINQRNPNSDHAKGVLRARGFFVHYLALTFSTLLSSQVSGAHRTGLVVLGLGQRPTLRGLASPSQTRTFSFIQDHQRPGFDASLASTHLSEHLAGQWIPPGSAATDR